MISIEDVDSKFLDDVKGENEEVISLKIKFNDHFLNIFFPIENEDLIQEDGDMQEPIYPKHDHFHEWNKMKHLLGLMPFVYYFCFYLHLSIYKIIFLAICFGSIQS